MERIGADSPPCAAVRLHEQLDENADLKCKDETEHPLHQQHIALERNHFIVSLAQSSRGLQRLLFRNIDRPESFETSLKRATMANYSGGKLRFARYESEPFNGQPVRARNFAAPQQHSLL